MTTEVLELGLWTNGVLHRQTLRLGVVVSLSRRVKQITPGLTSRSSCDKAAGLWADFIRLQDLQQKLKTLSRYAAVEQRFVNMKLQHREKVFALSCQTASIGDGSRVSNTTGLCDHRGYRLEIAFSCPARPSQDQTSSW